MGSWLSSPATPNYLRPVPEEWAAGFDFAALCELRDRRGAVHPPRTQQEIDARSILRLANRAIEHYNSNHPGVEYSYLDELSIESEMKASCIGFRRDLWYHVNFSARNATGIRRFFAELRYEQCSGNIIVETCSTLEGPAWCFIRICAFCSEESKILHPSNTEFRCGKEGDEKDFFRERCGTERHEKELFCERCGSEGHKKEVFSKSDMLKIPFLLGGQVPRYR
ncbi:uncharacterized protein LOC124671141 [Lolium rigidum]|uniref:uncharacterized protein LOC124671141 n=1 Tax=Lolium rigidum TaxID=89674 RepID=UPI001F5C4FD3|nr:uncharacterized protein LOC124671141 [Lolium rigidum]